VASACAVSSLQHIDTVGWVTGRAAALKTCLVYSQRFSLGGSGSELSNYRKTHTVTHTHTRLMARCPGLPGWAGTRKVKPIWILLKQETVSGSGISWAICKSAHLSIQITMPAPHHSVFLQAGCPSYRPTNSIKALKAVYTVRESNNKLSSLPITFWVYIECIHIGVERSRAVKGSRENEWVTAASWRPLQQITDEVPSLETLAKIDSVSTKTRTDRWYSFQQVLPPVSRLYQLIIFHYVGYVKLY